MITKLNYLYVHFYAFYCTITNLAIIDFNLNSNKIIFYLKKKLQ